MRKSLTAAERVKRREERLATVEDLTWQFIEKGLLTRRQLGKHIISASSQWVLAVYLYQDLNRRKGRFEGPKIAFVRYRWGKYGWLKMSNFNINLSQVLDVQGMMRYWAEVGEKLVEEADALQSEDPPSAAPPTSAGASASGGGLP